MDGHFVLHRDHLIKLCDATLSSELQPESLSAIAFALLASDAFEWDDDVIAEVISDWSAPEINYPMTERTLTMHRGWLTGLTVPPERSRLDAANAARGRLIAVRIKKSDPSQS
jgi:hypothetical protein